MDEVKDKNGEDIDVTSWKQEFVTDLPNQQNRYVRYKTLLYSCTKKIKWDYLGEYHHTSPPTSIILIMTKLMGSQMHMLHEFKYEAMSMFKRPFL